MSEMFIGTLLYLALIPFSIFTVICIGIGASRVIWMTTIDWKTEVHVYLKGFGVVLLIAGAAYYNDTVHLIVTFALTAMGVILVEHFLIELLRGNCCDRA